MANKTHQKSFRAGYQLRYISKDKEGREFWKIASGLYPTIDQAQTAGKALPGTPKFHIEGVRVSTVGAEAPEQREVRKTVYQYGNSSKNR